MYRRTSDNDFWIVLNRLLNLYQGSNARSEFFKSFLTHIRPLKMVYFKRIIKKCLVIELHTVFTT